MQRNIEEIAVKYCNDNARQRILKASFYKISLLLYILKVMCIYNACVCTIQGLYLNDMNTYTNRYIQKGHNNSDSEFRYIRTFKREMRNARRI